LRFAAPVCFSAGGAVNRDCLISRDDDDEASN
jgi:hypothetical protein